MTREVPVVRGVPEASVERLPGYLRTLTVLQEQGTTLVSSEELAAAAGVGSAMLRKDLSHLGSTGVRGVGYDVERLASLLAESLGLTRDWPVAIVGMGKLGRALAAHAGLAARGLRVVALLDRDPAVVGEVVAGQVVRPMSDLPRLEGLAIGVIATPAGSAQDAADALIEAGVGSILNLAPAVLSVPEDVVVRSVDLASELQVLAFHEWRKATSVVLPLEVS